MRQVKRKEAVITIVMLVMSVFIAYSIADMLRDNSAITCPPIPPRPPGSNIDFKIDLCGFFVSLAPYADAIGLATFLLLAVGWLISFMEQAPVEVEKEQQNET